MKSRQILLNMLIYGGATGILFGSVAMNRIGQPITDIIGGLGGIFGVLGLFGFFIRLIADKGTINKQILLKWLIYGGGLGIVFGGLAMYSIGQPITDIIGGLCGIFGALGLLGFFIRLIFDKE